MKRISKLITCLLAAAVICWVVACTCASHTTLGFPLRHDYLIMVPPWVTGVTRAQAKVKIKTWTRKSTLDPLGLKPLFGKMGLKLDDSSGFHIPGHGANGNAFVASLTKAQADLLRNHFSFTSTTAAPHRELIVSRIQCYRKDSLRAAGDTDGLLEGQGVGPTSTAAWAVDSVFACDNGTKLEVTQQRIPVLYVVDTGVKPFKGTSSSWQMSNQFVNVKVRQGQIGEGLDAEWPPQGESSVWGQRVQAPDGEYLDLQAPFALYPSTSGYLNPHEDPSGHGTKVASTAVGATMGVIGKLKKTSTGAPVEVHVEPIRIYANSPTGDPTWFKNPETTSLVVSSGIYLAVASHLARSQALGSTAASVLMFTSRSVSDFDEAVETALWWAWTKGMICVVSGGNEPGANPQSPVMHAPNAMWYTASQTFGSPQSTTPARYDWTKPANDTSGTLASYWPSGPVAIPNRWSLIIVGSNNVGLGTPGNPAAPFSGNQGWSSISSRGPDIDIVAPGKSVPCATQGSNNSSAATGSSLATGYVAGAALAYLATKPSISAGVPDDFKAWLTPTAGPGNGCRVLPTSPAGWSDGPYRHSPYTESPMNAPAAYNGKVPALYISELPAP